MMKKLLIPILLICFFASFSYSLDYTPLNSTTGTTGTALTPAQQQQQQTQNLTNQMVQIQGELASIKDSLNQTAKVEHLNQAIVVLKDQNEKQLNDFMLIFAIMQVVFYLALGSIYFIFKGRGRN